MGIDYQIHTYPNGSPMSGTEVAKFLGRREVFKTLVTVGKSKKNYVFVIPSDKELDLKKAAAAVGEKSIEMLRQRDLLPLTGYVHGGCSPVGMKKNFQTTLDKSALALPSIIFSAGKIGVQIETSPHNLSKIVRFKTADLTT